MANRRVVSHQIKTLFFTLVLLLIFALRPFSNVVAQQNGFTAPLADDLLTGVVVVQGTAVHPDFLRYELAFLQQEVPSAEWIVFAEGDQPINNGTLAVWDTAVGREFNAPIFPDGRYQLRLRVVKTDYNYDEYYLSDLLVQNEGPTPTPTPDETAVAGTATTQSAIQVATSEPNSFQQSTPIPSLTPFPTPTARATPINNSGNDAPAEPDTGEGGVIGQIESVEASRFGNAFLLGVQITISIFLLLALYILIRALFRRMRRVLWAKNKE